MFRRQAILSHPSCRTPPEDVLDTFIRSGRMKQMLKLVGAAIALALPSVAVGQVLKFEGIGNPAVQTVPIADFYNGGGGPNYGISFSDNALRLCLNTLTNFCSNTSRGGVGDPTSQLGGLVFFSGPSTFMNMSSGFTTGFSLFYSAPFFPGSLKVFSDINGGGDELASLNLPLTGNGTSLCPGYNANYCTFFPVGVGFTGTGKSIEFAGVANYIVFDDVTFGNVIPGTTVPEPASMMLLGTGLVGVFGAARRRRNSA